MSEMRMPYLHGVDSLAGDEGPSRYLQYLSDCLCYGLSRQSDQESRSFWARFRRATDALGISQVECEDISFEGEVVAVLNPANPGALAWARARIEHGLANAVDSEEPNSVLERLY